MGRLGVRGWLEVYLSFATGGFCIVLFDLFRTLFAVFALFILTGEPLFTTAGRYGSTRGRLSAGLRVGSGRVLDVAFLASNGVLLVNSILLFIDVTIDGADTQFNIPALLLFLFINVLFNASNFNVRFSSVHKTRFINVVTLYVVLFSNNVSAGFTRVGPILNPKLILSAMNMLLATLFANIFI